MSESISSLVQAHLLKEHKVGDEYTSTQIAQELGFDMETSWGAVSGYFNRAMRFGGLSLVEQRGKLFIFRQEEKLKEMRVRKIPGAGSQKGRGDGSHTRAKPPASLETLRDRLLEIAATLEKLSQIPKTPDLRAVSKEDLLKELIRRERNSAHE